MAEQPIRLLIADDQALVREGFAVLLNAQPDLTVVGMAQDGEEALDKVAELSPDVVLMDIRMPRLTGLEATRRLLQTDDGLPRGDLTPSYGHTVPKVLILTTFDLDDYVYEALHAGASGFLLKDASAHQLCDAVRTIAAGEALLAPTITRRLIAEYTRLRGSQDPRARSIVNLTERETEVLRHLAQGLSNAEIALRLLIAEQTVKTHVSRILIKLGLRDRTQAVVFAYESGLVQASKPVV
ncbi:response regulator [Streptomyces chartreusis]|uniref:response regulator n=1 Tax=Streptomyces chartreusis TaxID=1969 RepID=UPI00382547E9